MAEKRNTSPQPNWEKGLRWGHGVALEKKVPSRIKVNTAKRLCFSTCPKSATSCGFSSRAEEEPVGRRKGAVPANHRNGPGSSSDLL